MKILHVLHGFAPEFTGGTERTVEAIARSMQQSGHEVLIVCGSLEAGLPHEPTEIDHDGLRVIRLHRDDLYHDSWDKAFAPETSLAFRKLLLRERPDVVHVHHWIRLTSNLCRTAKQLQVPVVAVTAHDYWTQQASPVRGARDEAPVPPVAPAWMSPDELREAFVFHRDDLGDELRAADIRFAPCESHGQGIQSFAPDEVGDFEIATPPLLEVPPRRPESDEPRGKRLIYWGSIYPEKGLEVVFDALFSIQSGWSLEVYGTAHEPEYDSFLRQRAEGMPVRFHGAFTPTDLASAEGDYAVLPSTCHESYGLVLDEARALGLPTIASDLPGYREHADAEATVFFWPGDAGDLAMILVDEARLQSLPRPSPPSLQNAARAAESLLDHYERSRTEGGASIASPRRVDPMRRARHQFRTAERRLWSALQHGPELPPSDFIRRPGDRV